LTAAPTSTPCTASPGGGPGGWWALDLQAIDLAIWGSNICAAPKRDFETARLLVARGADHDLTIAAALGDGQRVTALLDENPSHIREKRPNGKHPLSAAVEFGHEALARVLLARGADPRKGTALPAAASTGDGALVELLLAHGADPTGAVYAAKTPELRALLMAHGGTLDPYELVWMNQDDEVIRRVKADPRSAECGCGCVFTAVCTLGKRELLLRLLDAGIRVPPVLTACRGYLLEDTEMFRILLDSGMNPDLPNWQRQTFLHDLCRGGKRGQIGRQLELAAILLDAGASISAREEEYGSTPLGWAARTNMPEMVEFLLARGAITNLPDDEPWATPLAWADRRGHAEVAEILRKHGAVR
jgi:ankyrin repeat protein